jgi:hypothetical protein
MYDFHADPEPDFLYTDGLNLLTDDERTVGLAHLRLTPILQALQNNPFNARVIAELREYLDFQADEAMDAFNRLCELGPTYLTDRLAELNAEYAEEGW